MPRPLAQASNRMVKEKRSAPPKMMMKSRAAPRRDECEGMVMMSAAPAMAESSNAFDDDMMMRLNALDSGPMKRSASPVFEEMCAMNVVEECDMMVAKSAMVMESRAP